MAKKKKPYQVYQKGGLKPLAADATRVAPVKKVLKPAPSLYAPGYVPPTLGPRDFLSRREDLGNRSLAAMHGVVETVAGAGADVAEWAGTPRSKQGVFAPLESLAKKSKKERLDATNPKYNDSWAHPFNFIAEDGPALVTMDPLVAPVINKGLKLAGKGVDAALPGLKPFVKKQLSQLPTAGSLGESTGNVIGKNLSKVGTLEEFKYLPKLATDFVEGWKTRLSSNHAITEQEQKILGAIRSAGKKVAENPTGVDSKGRPVMDAVHKQFEGIDDGTLLKITGKTKEDLLNMYQDRVAPQNFGSINLQRPSRISQADLITTRSLAADLEREAAGFDPIAEERHAREFEEFVRRDLERPDPEAFANPYAEILNPSTLNPELEVVRRRIAEMARGRSLEETSLPAAPVERNPLFPETPVDMVRENQMQELDAAAARSMRYNESVDDVVHARDVLGERVMDAALDTPGYFDMSYNQQTRLRRRLAQQIAPVQFSGLNPEELNNVLNEFNRSLPEKVTPVRSLINKNQIAEQIAFERSTANQLDGYNYAIGSLSAGDGSNTLKEIYNAKKGFLKAPTGSKFVPSSSLSADSWNVAHSFYPDILKKKVADVNYLGMQPLNGMSFPERAGVSPKVLSGEINKTIDKIRQASGKKIPYSKILKGQVYYPSLGLKKFQQGGLKKAYNPSLAAEDKDFNQWYKTSTLEGQNNLPYSDQQVYDYYSFYKNQEHKNPNFNIEKHFPDTYKRPSHPTFSNESIYSTPENPGGSWSGENFIPMKNTKLKLGFKSGGTIHIKPENRGKFNATKAATGKTTEQLTHSSNPLTRKRAIFAQNAAKWHHHQMGGIVAPQPPVDPNAAPAPSFIPPLPGSTGTPFTPGIQVQPGDPVFTVPSEHENYYIGKSIKGFDEDRKADYDNWMGLESNKNNPTASQNYFAYRHIGLPEFQRPVKKPLNPTVIPGQSHIPKAGNMRRKLDPLHIYKEHRYKPKGFQMGGEYTDMNTQSAMLMQANNTPVKKKKFVSGSKLKPNFQTGGFQWGANAPGGGGANTGAMFGAAGNLGASLVDTFAPVDEYGVRKPGAAVASGALKGAASGAMFGPIGAAVGGLAGGAMAFFNNKKASTEAEQVKKSKLATIATNNQNTSQGILANYSNMGTGIKSFNHGGLQTTAGGKSLLVSAPGGFGNDGKYHFTDKTFFKGGSFQEGGLQAQGGMPPVDGGNLQPVGDGSAFQVKGADPNATDDVQMGDSFVDHNEVVEPTEEGMRIYSDTLKHPVTGKPFSVEAKKLTKQKSFTKNAAQDALVDAKLDALFALQQKLNGDNQGESPEEALQPEGETPGQGMSQGNMFRKGGLSPVNKPYHDITPERIGIKAKQAMAALVMNPEKSDAKEFQTGGIRPRYERDYYKWDGGNQTSGNSFAPTSLTSTPGLTLNSATRARMGAGAGTVAQTTSGNNLKPGINWNTAAGVIGSLGSNMANAALIARTPKVADVRLTQAPTLQKYDFSDQANMLKEGYRTANLGLQRGNVMQQAREGGAAANLAEYNRGVNSMMGEANRANTAINNQQAQLNYQNDQSNNALLNKYQQDQQARLSNMQANKSANIADVGNKIQGFAAQNEQIKLDDKKMAMTMAILNKTAGDAGWRSLIELGYTPQQAQALLASRGNVTEPETASQFSLKPPGSTFTPSTPAGSLFAPTTKPLSFRQPQAQTYKKGGLVVVKKKAYKMGGMKLRRAC